MLTCELECPSCHATKKYDGTKSELISAIGKDGWRAMMAEESCTVLWCGRCKHTDYHHTTFAEIQVVADAIV